MYTFQGLRPGEEGTVSPQVQQGEAGASPPFPKGKRDPFAPDGGERKDLVLILTIWNMTYSSTAP